MGVTNAGNITACAARVLGTHPGTKEALAAWFRLLDTNEFSNFNEIRKTFGGADYVAPFTLFDVGGNKLRIITVIHYNRRCVYIRHVLTHREYDDWTDKMRKVKGGKR